MTQIRMKQPAIFERIYRKLNDSDIPTVNKIRELLTQSEFIDFKTYLKIFSKTMFRVNHKEMSDNNIHQIMVLRREFYIDEPTDNDEFDELIKYFESDEDYESCQRITKSKNEYNKN